MATTSCLRLQHCTSVCNVNSILSTSPTSSYNLLLHPATSTSASASTTSYQHLQRLQHHQYIPHVQRLRSHTPVYFLWTFFLHQYIYSTPEDSLCCFYRQFPPFFCSYSFSRNPEHLFPNYSTPSSIQMTADSPRPVILVIYRWRFHMYILIPAQPCETPLSR